MSRRLAREELFKIVFESEINGKDLDTVLASYLERENEVELNEKGKEFLVEYAKGISENQDKILAELDEKMEGWSFERVGNVEKALLKISVYEILFKDTPKEIIINEAVELAKKYGDVKTYEFVNGVLAKLV
ncbi:transcription antitermination factor NusB [Fusobacterium perfoetens]|uniref:transcription antitermination factor NusB n=1 Tax=Fusobacterium perfoetens TaxID=852 RepID=UPI0015A228F3|nr:transcription antitermination factor NusB [Fusobacterium perfoetens]MCF2625441.1 transcription antitermination factor NusB [Fusobacterium perfoetens]